MSSEKTVEAVLLRSGAELCASEYLTDLATWAGWTREELREYAFFETELLLATAWNCSRTTLLLRRKDPLPEQISVQFQQLLARRFRGEPVPYIIGSREFYGRTFEVNSDVLIPRPETETLIDAVLEDVSSRTGGVRLIDVGTGSGIILVTLLAEFTGQKEVTGVGLDVSTAALETAKRNADALGVGKCCTWLQSDLLEAVIGSENGFDVVVANLPYISDDASLPRAVREFEPGLALFGGADGLDLIRRLVEQFSEKFQGGSLLYLEIGSDQAASLKKWIETTPEVEIKKFDSDLAGKARVVRIVRR